MSASPSLAGLNPGSPQAFVDGSCNEIFAKLRADDPVHYCPESEFGPYWSITRHEDIMFVDTHPAEFSSDAKHGGVLIMDIFTSELPAFIQMDPPAHTMRRKAASPAVAPNNLANLEGLIRERTAAVLDTLPVGEEFDWVERVSLDLTAKMLATLFDWPIEDRFQLTRWSDLTTTIPGVGGIVETEEERTAELMRAGQIFSELFQERAAQEPKDDLISMLAHSPSSRNMSPADILGDMLLLIVGGNDTTRNSMTGSVLAMNRFPEQYAKVCARPELIPGAVSEIIRWQTPLAHMRRTATQDVEVHGKTIRKGDKVVMWYFSGNRDESIFPDAESLDIERANVRRHVSFGFGIHRCVGNRLAEQQLRILWEEILKRWPNPGQLVVTGDAVPVPSSFVRGYLRMPVRIGA